MNCIQCINIQNMFYVGPLNTWCLIEMKCFNDFYFLDFRLIWEWADLEAGRAFGTSQQCHFLRQPFD